MQAMNYEVVPDAPVELNVNESAGKPDKVPKEKELTERVESVEDSGRLENAAATSVDDTNEKIREEFTGEHDEEKVAEPQDQVAVFVTAVFEDGSQDTLDQADLRSLEEII